jgi:hypothetical protein
MKEQDFSQLLKNPLISKELLEFQALKNDLLQVDLFRKGSISKSYQVCGKKNCRCHINKEFRHGPYYYWTLKVKGKTVTLKIPSDDIPLAQMFIDNSKNLQHKLKHLEALSDSIIKKIFQEILK